MAPWSGLTIKAASSVLLAALGCLALASEHIDARTGIPIRVTVDDAMFPDAWKIGDVDARAMPLAPGEVDRSLRLAREAMSVYPAIVLQKNLRAVYVSQEIRFYGLAYGGTNSRDVVYIANNGVAHGYSDRFIVRTFHHELSSILLRNNQEAFDAQAWTKENRTKYGEGGIEALKSGTAETQYAEKFHVDGFLSQYGSASLEEDFNTFAEALFTGDRQFWSINDRFPRIRAKTAVFIAFYQSLDPSLNEAYFRKLKDAANK